MKIGPIMSFIVLIVSTNIGYAACASGGTCTCPATYKQAEQESGWITSGYPDPSVPSIFKRAQFIGGDSEMMCEWGNRDYFMADAINRDCRNPRPKHPAMWAWTETGKVCNNNNPENCTLICE